MNEYIVEPLPCRLQANVAESVGLLAIVDQKIAIPFVGDLKHVLGYFVPSSGGQPEPAVPVINESIECAPAMHDIGDAETPLQAFC